MNLATGIAQAFKGLGAGHLMDELAVDIDQTTAVFLPVDEVALPDLIKKGLRLGHDEKFLARGKTVK